MYKVGDKVRVVRVILGFSSIPASQRAPIEKESIGKTFTIVRKISDSNWPIVLAGSMYSWSEEELEKVENQLSFVF